MTEYPCPTVEWKILKAQADLANKTGKSAAAGELAARAPAVVQALADSVMEADLREKMLASREAREIQE